MASHIPPSQNKLTKTAKDADSLGKWAIGADKKLLKLEARVATLEKMLEEMTAKPKRGRRKTDEE